MALVDTYYFVPGTISVSMIGAGTADHRALVSVTQGTKIRLSAQLLTSLTKKYADDLSFRTWLVTGLNTRFSSAYMRTDNYALRLPIYIYVRLDASTSGTAAQLIFSPYQYTIGGLVFTDTEHDLLANVLKTDVTEIYDRTKSVEAQLATQNGTTFTEETAVRTIAPANLDTNGTTYKQNYLYLRIGTINTDDKVTIPEGTLSTDYAKEQQSDSALEAMFRFNTEGTAITPQKPFTSLAFFLSGVEVYINRILNGDINSEEAAQQWADEHAIATTSSTAQYIQYALLALENKYLRKDQDDSTPYTLTIGNAIIGKRIVTHQTDEEDNDVEIVTWEEGDIDIKGDATIGGILNVDGNTTIGGDTTIGGTAAISGNATIGGTATIDKDTTIKGKSYLKDDVAIGNPVKAEVSGTTGGATISKEGDIAARSLALSEFLEAPEIRFNRASIVVGTNIQSPCGGIIKEVYPDKDEEGKVLPAGYAVLELGDDDIAGSIVAGDYCWGYFHDVNTKSNNATEDSDDHAGNISYKGFATVYFYIQEILNANSTRFRYELREGTTIHPYVGMHFGGRGNNTDKSRQGFKVATPNYTATYQLVTSWDMSPVSHVVKVSGRLDGFEALAGYKANTWKNHFGTIDTNLYYRGNAMQRDLDQYFLYITQSSNGMLQPGETEKVSIVVRGSSFYNATKAFTVKVNGVVVTPNDDGEITLTYKYSDLTDELTRIPVVATYVATESKTYTLTGQISIRKLVDTITSMDISIAGDSLLALGETKKVAFRLLTNTGFDVTSQAWKWLIERGSFNTSGEWTQTDADKVWGARQKARAFNQQSYTSDAFIMLTWSDNPTENDLDPDINVSATTFRITATIGDEEIQETIEI